MLKNITGLFWSSGSDEDEPAPPKKQTPAKTARVVESEEPEPPARSSGSNQKMRKHLMSLVQKADLPGFDYLEFLQAMKDVEDDIPDEATRMRTVFATAKSMKITPQGLIDAANHYIDVLAEEKTNFENALAEKNSDEIGDKKKELANINKTINDNNAEIERLNAEIAKAETAKSRLNSEIAESESRITNAKTDFSTAYDELVASIKSDIKKIKVNLGVKT